MLLISRKNPYFKVQGTKAEVKPRSKMYFNFKTYQIVQKG